MSNRAGQLDALNDALKRAEDRLYDLNVGAAGRVSLDGATALVWEKFEGRWGLGIDCGEGPVRLLESKAEHRVAAALMLDDLLVDAREALDAASQQIAAAVAAADAFLPFTDFGPTFDATRRTD